MNKCNTYLGRLGLVNYGKWSQTLVESVTWSIEIGRHDCFASKWVGATYNLSF